MWFYFFCICGWPLKGLITLYSLQFTTEDRCQNVGLYFRLDRSERIQMFGADIKEQGLICSTTVCVNVYFLRLWTFLKHCVCPKWHPIPYVVHFIGSGPIGNRVPFGSHTLAGKVLCKWHRDLVAYTGQFHDSSTTAQCLDLQCSVVHNLTDHAQETGSTAWKKQISPQIWDCHERKAKA